MFRVGDGFKRKNLVILLIFSVAALQCSKKSADDIKSDKRAESLEKRGITADTCSFCAIDGLVVKTVSQDVNSDIVIDHPVAIELFNKIEIMFRYNNEEKYDTLMKLFKMRSAGDRNEIYRLTDLYGYYSQGIKPVLIKNSVTIIDTIKHTRYLTIKDGEKKYVVDLMHYRKDDGVIMFRPGKHPIYWTMDRDWKNCYNYYGFPKWYYNCGK